MEAYRDRCTTLLVRLHGLVPSATLDEAQHLVDHGEPSIGVETAAWGLVNAGVAVPRELIDNMRTLVVDENELPPGLDSLASDI